MSTYPSSQTFFVGATKPDLVCHVTIGNSNTWKNWTGASSVYFNMRLDSDGTMKVDDQIATISGAATGELTYEWGANDLNTAGLYIGWFVVYWSAAKTDPEPTYGFEINVVQPYQKVVT